MWLNRYLRFWNQQLDRLAAFVEDTPCPPTQPQASRQAKPHPQTSSQCRAGKGLRGVDEPRAPDPWFGPDPAR